MVALHGAITWKGIFGRDRLVSCEQGGQRACTLGGMLYQAACAKRGAGADVAVAGKSSALPEAKEGNNPTTKKASMEWVVVAAVVDAGMGN